ncbi:uncharacterized protein LOC123531059 [Mercenaria mercenaria]|uniref:uncharacterized protein LOC123531059 n=1 Tax=Mercenaria mercenaria TaxID=6596 RepID=UPI00234F9553|nr:uncharacterized protein LOC123531059 [Mercenaria mercenaria]XP_053373567.1 uncharacterized protein LOC123531059 [Mercenaria mercenaria]XP_053373568.1 uncharacterized protein LOC123531059 [Mercenaria mercenaria]XP_053373569.1 uncharacterized protein LOC123531059 [Mercenaria mercenaria]
MTIEMTTGPLEAHVTCKCNQLKFSTKAAYPQCRCKHVSCLHENYIYVYAGKDGNISLRDFWRLSISNLKWEALSFRGDTPQHLEGHTLVSCKKLLLLFGGEFGDCLTESSLWIINPDLGYIRKTVLDVGSERPCIRRHHSAVVYNGAMYIYGGYIDMKGSSAELWRYQVDDEEWELVSPRQQIRNTPSGRHGHTAVVYNKHMWLYGGNTDLSAKQDLWSYSFGVNRWDRVKLKYGPPALTGHTATVIGTRMFIFGGETSREPCNQLWYYCFRTLRWTQIFLKEQIPSRTFHSALLVTPSNQQDNSVKAGSVPYLQKKIAKLSLERPRSSPGVRPGSSKLLQKSGSQDSLHVEKSVSSRSRSRSLSKEGVTINRTCIEKPNVLKLYAEGSEECLKMEPSPSENTADKSPLCPKKMDVNYNAIDMLDRNTVNNGLDNPGISDSTEELIRESYTKHGRLKTEILCDRNRPSAFMRSLSYMTEQEKRKNMFCDSSETLVSVIAGSYDSLVSEGDDRLETFTVKKSRLDPELVLEDLEYLDCFPHDIQIPYPNSTPFRFSSFKSAESLLHDSGKLETIELERCHDFMTTNKVRSSSVTEMNVGSESVKFNKNRDSVQICGLQRSDNVENMKNRENLTKSGQLYEKIKHDRDSRIGVRETTLEKQEVGREVMETTFQSVNVNPSQNESVSGIYRKNTKSPPKAVQSTEPPYILIIGGKDNTTVNFGIKPLPLWKLQINSMS